MVVDESVAGKLITLRAGREMDADRTILEPVVSKDVPIGVVDEDALPGSSVWSRRGGCFFRNVSFRIGPVIGSRDRVLRPLAQDDIALDPRVVGGVEQQAVVCLLYTSPSPRDS